MRQKQNKPSKLTNSIYYKTSISGTRYVLQSSGLDTRHN